ncbi:MAG: AI-2E family transporter [Proteobacteria bacterium]|nr:AI-2E family transporter [Pseudomonadota bacterium]
MPPLIGSGTIPAISVYMNGRVQVSGTTRMALFTTVIVVVVLKLAQEVFIPLALAILCTFLLAPLVVLLTRIGTHRIIAVVLSMCLGLATIGGLGTLVFNQFADLARELPSYQHQLRTNLAQWGGLLRGGVAETTAAFDQLTKEIDRVAPTEPKPRGVSRVQVVDAPVTALERIRDVVGPVIRPLGTTLAVIVLVAFMLLRLPDLRDRILRLLGPRYLHLTTEALNDAAGRVSRYLLMQIVINGWTGLAVTAGLWALNVPNAVLWGALTLVLRFIPYVGVWMAAAIPLALSFAVFDDWTRPLMVFGLFAVLELFAWSVLEPWLYGTHTGVSPVALLLAAGFWTWLWGFAGLFLAVPMTVCAAVMGKYIPQLKFLQVLLGDEPVLEPFERLYQRLLSSNRDEADTVLEAALRESSIIDVCDAVIVPAIMRAEEDHSRGTLNDVKRQHILEHVNEWVDERLEMLAPERSGFANRDIADAQSLVLCVPASDRADEIIAKLLEAALIEHKLEAKIVGPRDAIELASNGRVPRAIVISALPPEAVTAARTVCKELRKDNTGVPVIVGLWSAAGELDRSRQRLAAAGATRTVITFAECFALLEGSLSPDVAARVAPVSEPREATEA